MQLRNNLVAGSLTVTPVLRLIDGSEISLDPVTISSNSAVSIPVSQALLSRAPNLLTQPGTFGSVAFRYTALHARNLAAVSAVHMHGQPIGFHVDAFPVSHNTTAGSMEGIWWQPRPTVKDILVISNSSDKKIGGVLSLSDASGKQWHDRWSLSPHETQRLNVADLVRKAGLAGNYGGITFASASLSALDGTHFLYDETSGFSALMNMIDRDPAAKLEERTWAGNKQWTMWAPMLALRTPDPAAGFPNGTGLEPMIFLRNATAKNVSASIQLTWRGESAKGRAHLPEVRLKPFETRQLEIGAMQKQLGIPDDAHWALVTLTSPASPDDLMAVAASYDSTGRYGAQTPFSDNLGAYWAGGQWQVDTTHNAIVAVTNGGNRATKALLTLHFDDGKKNYEIEQTIQAGDQMWLNLADLIHHGVPDRKGNALPTEVTSGTYELEDLDPGLGGNLIEGKVTLDKTFGHLTYGCLTCCGSTPYLSPGTLGLGVGGDGFIGAMGNNNCTGATVNLQTYFSGSTARWWSGNSSTATVTSFKGHGVAPGSTNGLASATVPSGDGGVPKSPCPQLTQEGDNQVTVSCPATTTVSALTPLSITLLFPSLKTGIGAVAAMQVGPTTTNWDGSQLLESLTTVSNSCPASFGNICTGSSTFTVGNGGQAQVSVNGVPTLVGPVFPGQENIFYDQHTATSSISKLDEAGINSCTAVCSQTYTSAVSPFACIGVPAGTHTITLKFIQAQINGTHVTSTEVSKQ